jgi:hypothetical protein
MIMENTKFFLLSKQWAVLFFLLMSCCLLICSGCSYCLDVEPSQGAPGETLNVTVISVNTSFDDTTMVAFSCDRITVNNVQYISTTEITVSITIAEDASAGTCDITITTGNEKVICEDVFTIVSESPSTSTSTFTSTSTSIPTNPDDLLANDFEPATGPGEPPPGADNLGPWATRVMLAESDDGLTFTRTGGIVADQGGVPNIIVDNEGRTRMYYQAWQQYGTENGNDGNFMAFAIRKDETSPWYYHKVILNKTYAPPAVDPSMVLLQNGYYRLYYMADLGNFTLRILSATSSNLGLIFKQDDDERLAPDDPVFDPMVLKVSNGWLMVAGPDGEYSATSDDGLLFTEIGPFEVDRRRFHAWAGVELPGGGYRLYGYFIDDGGLTSVSSTDGVTWQEDPGYRLTESGADPKTEAGFLNDVGVAVLPDGTFLMAYLAIIPEAL